MKNNLISLLSKPVVFKFLDLQSLSPDFCRSNTSNLHQYSMQVTLQLLQLLEQIAQQYELKAL
jgi:hypothetical protein